MKKIATIDGEVLTVDGEAVEVDDDTETKEYNIGAGLKLDAETNTLSVDTANAVEKDNTKPVTSAAVYTALSGGIQSAQIDEIRVLTKSDYDALDEKDARTLYLVEG